MLSATYLHETYHLPFGQSVITHSKEELTDSGIILPTRLAITRIISNGQLTIDSSSGLVLPTTEEINQYGNTPEKQDHSTLPDTTASCDNLGQFHIIGAQQILDAAQRLGSQVAINVQTVVPDEDIIQSMRLMGQELYRLQSNVSEEPYVAQEEKIGLYM